MITEFSRTEMLIGPKALNALKESCVVVFGAGGVGSHAIEALARSGIGHLILIDSDTVSLTNINRQSIAYHSTVGQYKTRVMADRIRDICRIQGQIPLKNLCSLIQWRRFFAGSMPF